MNDVLGYFVANIPSLISLTTWIVMCLMMRDLGNDIIEARARND
jgi:hypothetical protein